MVKNKIIKWVIFIFFVTVVFELFSEVLLNIMWAQLNKRIKPYYQFSFYTQSGQQIGRNRGVHKLMYHPQVGYVNLPNQETPYLKINAQGFRNSKDVSQEKGSKKRIIILGGSTAFGTGLNGNDQTFAYQLEKRLGDVEVLNAAVIGHRSGQELVYLIKDIVDYHPDLVLVLDGGNDAFQISTPKERWFDVNGGSQYENELKTLNNLVYANLFSRIAHLPAILFTKSGSVLSMGKDSFVMALKKSLSQDVKDRLKGRKSIAKTGEETVLQFSKHQLDVKAVSDRYVKNIKKMDIIAKAYQCKFLCVIQPTQSTIAGKGMDERHHKIYAEFRAIVDKRLKQENVEHFDLNAFSATLAPAMFMDEAHLNEHGNAIMADIVSEYIMKHNLL